MGNPQAAQSGQNGYSDEEVRKQSSEAAQKALDAQQKAYELKQAAHGAADPEERQKLLEEALDREIEAESFGKTAKYLRSGTFQGMAMGTGMGIAPGASLGAITGTLVGGVTSLITGGLGGAIGAGVGFLHGPFWNMGEVAGKSIQKVTGNLPGWKATKEQKEALEQMIRDVKNQDMPNKGELESMKRDRPKQTWGQSAASMMPSMSWPSWGKSEDKETGNDSKPSQPASYSTTQARHDADSVQRVDQQGVARLQEAQAQAEQGRSKPSNPSNKSAQRQSGAQPASKGASSQQTGYQEPRKKPRKLEVRKAATEQAPGLSKDGQLAKKKPRKLETRSKPVRTAG